MFSVDSSPIETNPIWYIAFYSVLMGIMIEFIIIIAVASIKKYLKKKKHPTRSAKLINSSKY